jgi:lipopolysaccharide export system permease protein
MIFARYLVREFLKILIAILFLFMFFFVVADFLDNARYFIKYGAPGNVILQYYLATIPKIMVDVLPFAVLFSAIINMWIFSRNGEVSAMRAAGVSVLKMNLPLALVGVLLSVGAFLAGEFIIPQSQLMLRYVETVKIRKKEYDPMFLESKWVKGSEGVLHFEKFDPVTKVLYNPQYYVFSSASSVKTFAYANRAFFDERSFLWTLEDAVVTSFDRDGSVGKVKVHPLLVTSVTSEPPRILREGITSDQLSFRELRDLIRLSRRSGGNLASREVDLHLKLSLPFANLLFMFLAMPFALRSERQADTYVNVVLCLLAAILYWVGNASAKTMAQNGLLNPMVAAWSANFLFLAAAIIILRKLDRGR